MQAVLQDPNADLYNITAHSTNTSTLPNNMLDSMADESRNSTAGRQVAVLCHLSTSSHVGSNLAGHENVVLQPTCRKRTRI
jgi:hypothetical protein